jgi:hypothetical protein
MTTSRDVATLDWGNRGLDLRRLARQLTMRKLGRPRTPQAPLTFPGLAGTFADQPLPPFSTRSSRS